MEGTDEYEGFITHGPWGGSHGKEWVYRPQGFIRKIFVRFSDVIHSITFETETQSSSFGVTLTSKTDTISIDSPNEYIVSLSGTYGPYLETVVLKSICFKTNIKCYGPYGDTSGTAFSSDCKGGVIVGFHGRVFPHAILGNFITAIGIYVMPELFALGPHSPYVGRIVHEPPPSLSRVEMPREVGPWGAGGGKPWDDGVFSSVKQVSVHLGELNIIYALQFEYLKKDGKSVLSQIHGRTDGAKKIELVSLDGEEEFFTGISGFLGPVEGQNGLEAIASISFHTNKRIHGPYGEEKGAGYYRSTTSSGKIVGFQGRNNSFLSAIGVHMEYF